MRERPKPSTEEQLGLERIVFFSDSVMAIAITLLALNLRVPDIDPAQAAQLPARLVAMGPSFMTFIISFLMVAIYWISHHRYFGYIRGYDTRLVLLNLLFLFFITCMPFLASLLGRYSSVPLVLVIYSLAIAALGVSLGFIWRYASRGYRLITDEISANEIRAINIRLSVGPLMFLIAVPFAYVGSTAVIIVWWLSPLVVLLATRLLGTKPAPGRDTRARH